MFARARCATPQVARQSPLPDAEIAFGGEVSFWTSLHIIRLPRRHGRAASAGFFLVARQAALKDLTLDHLAKDGLHVPLRKGSQRLSANISKGTTAQSKRSHGNVIWCLDNRDEVVLA